MVDTALAERLVNAIRHLEHELGVYHTIRYPLIQDQDEIRASYNVVVSLAGQLHIPFTARFPQMRLHEAEDGDRERGTWFVQHSASPEVWQSWDRELKALLAAARELALPTNERAKVPLATGDIRTDADDDPTDNPAIHKAANRLLKCTADAPVTEPADSNAKLPCVSAEAEILYVDLDQIAAVVQRSKSCLEKRKGRRKNPLPRADIKGGGGKKDEWLWTKIRPWLQDEFRRVISQTCPRRLS